jgi:endonuclease-3
MATLSEIEETIRGGGLSRVKARRIKAILEEVERQKGELNLEFLRHLPDGEVRSYLGQFAGVGPKTIACVMLFSRGRPAFPWIRMFIV